MCVPLRNFMGAPAPGAPMLPTPVNGVNFDFLKQARKVLEQEGVKSVDQRQYVLLLDEMKVKT